jgi:hypothetical protein
MMAYYRVIMRVDIERIVEATSEKDALEKVDSTDMMFELKHYGVDEEFIVEKAWEE